MEYISIKSVEDLLEIKPHKAYRLTRDIDCGNTKHPFLLGDFVGEIDGDGYCIKNLTISESEITINSQPVAMFYTMSRSIVKNLKILNLKIEVPKSVYKPEVAALCVEASDTLFENVYVEAEATGITKLPLIYDSNNCEYVNVKVSNNMILAKFN